MCKASSDFDGIVAALSSSSPDTLSGDSSYLSISVVLVAIAKVCDSAECGAPSCVRCGLHAGIDYNLRPFALADCRFDDVQSLSMPPLSPALTKQKLCIDLYEIWAALHVICVIR